MRHEPSVYRVCAGSGARWHVFQDELTEPVASFDDKSAALTYAMCLARGRVSWHLLPGGPGEIARSGFRHAHGI